MKRLLALPLLLALFPLPARAQGDLRGQLDLLFSDPAFARALWGVEVRSLEKGDLLYQHNPHRYLVPASNMKLLTAVAALEVLGPAHRFQTRVLATGPVRGGVLRGNLVIQGGGDPTLGARLGSDDPLDFTQGHPLLLLQDWTARLKQAGISRIAGDIVADASIFAPPALGAGWAWDDLPYGYSAEISGLSFNENVALLTMVAGKKPGDAVSLAVSPKTSYFSLIERLVTGDFNARPEWRVEREAGSRRITIEGVLPAGGGTFHQTVSVPDPPLYLASLLRETLEAAGVRLSGRVREGRAGAPDARLLFSQESPPLREILRILLKVSQNLYAEMLLRQLDLNPAGKRFETGREQVRRVLRRAGVPRQAYAMEDGSGLSRYNFVTADTLIRLLEYAHRKWGKDFLELLPLAGVDGTLEGRLTGTPAAQRVRAKTGTLLHVRALSGVVTSAEGEEIAFSVIANHFTESRQSAEYLQDQLLQILTGFHR